MLTDLLALDCVFVTFPCGILGQVRYLILSIHDLCHINGFFSRQIRLDCPCNSPVDACLKVYVHGFEHFT